MQWAHREKRSERAAVTYTREEPVYMRAGPESAGSGLPREHTAHPPSRIVHAYIARNPPIQILLSHSLARARRPVQKLPALFSYAGGWWFAVSLLGLVLCASRCAKGLFLEKRLSNELFAVLGLFGGIG